MGEGQAPGRPLLPGLADPPVDRPRRSALALLFYVLARSAGGTAAAGRSQPCDGLLLAVGVLVVAFFAAPSDLAGGGFINHRLVLLPFLVLILWFATFEHPPRRRLGDPDRGGGDRRRLPGAYRARQYAGSTAAWRRSWRPASSSQPDHTFVFLYYVHQWTRTRDPELGAFRTRPFFHAGGYLAARRRLVDLSLYEANENYFPIYFQPRPQPLPLPRRREAGDRAGPPERGPPRLPEEDGPAAASTTSSSGDCATSRGGEPKVRYVLAQLAAGYQPVYTSPDGWVRLFRVKAD